MIDKRKRVSEIYLGLQEIIDQKYYEIVNNSEYNKVK